MCLIPLKNGQKESGVRIVDGERRIQVKFSFFTAKRTLIQRDC